MQECGVGEAGLCKQAQLEEMTICFDQVFPTEGVGRQRIQLAYRRGLGPVLATFNHILGLTVQPLTRNANRTSLSVPHPGNNNRTHNHHHHVSTDPVPYEEYLQ